MCIAGDSSSRASERKIECQFNYIKLYNTENISEIKKTTITWTYTRKVMILLPVNFSHPMGCFIDLVFGNINT